MWYFSNFMDSPYFASYVLLNLKMTINYTGINELPCRYTKTDIDYFVVMPNHIHRRGNS